MATSNSVYFDNSATTPLSPAAKARITELLDTFGNPSSLHAEGRTAAAILQSAREQVAGALGLRSVAPGELVFTSCGSEADSLALFGTTHAKARRTGNKIITTDSEHPAVENVMRALEGQGWRVVRISTRGGVLDMQELSEELDDETFLVSLMAVNNEAGAQYDLRSAFALAKARNPAVITHTDAVQGFLKCPLTPAAIGADLISLSGHKVHAPKGVGALYISPALLRAKKIVPFLLGGGQEAGMRSGTENLLGIAAFGAAVADALPRREQSVAHMHALRERAEEGLRTLGVDVKVPLGARAPHIVNLTLPDIKSETMLHFLDARGIRVSAGSACSSHGKSPSRSLLAFGVTPRQADCSLRLSFSEYNTEAEVDTFLEALGEGLRTLIRIRR